MATKSKERPAKLSIEDALRVENFALRAQLIERGLVQFERERGAFWGELGKRYDFTPGVDQIGADGAIVRQEKKEEKQG